MDGVQTALMYNDEKMVVRPGRVRGFWMHYAMELNEGQPMHLPTKFAIMLHAANADVAVFCSGPKKRVIGYKFCQNLLRT
jgi:hypothetical protein